MLLLTRTLGRKTFVGADDIARPAQVYGPPPAVTILRDEALPYPWPVVPLAYVRAFPSEPGRRAG